jgi:hypothetical protein
MTSITLQELIEEAKATVIGEKEIAALNFRLAAQDKLIQKIIDSHTFPEDRPPKWNGHAS